MKKQLVKAVKMNDEMRRICKESAEFLEWNRDSYMAWDCGLAEREDQEAHEAMLETTIRFLKEEADLAQEVIEDDKLFVECLRYLEWVNDGGFEKYQAKVANGEKLYTEFNTERASSKAFCYALFELGGRFVEGEYAISKSMRTQELYEKYILGGQPLDTSDRIFLKNKLAELEEDLLFIKMNYVSRCDLR